jgi:hypothetical protein
LLHLLLEVVIQPAFPAFGRMEKASHHTIYPAALPLEEPANRTSGEMNGKLDPFPNGQRGMLPFLDEVGGMTTVVLYFLYYSHNLRFITMIFEYRREGSAWPGE